MKKLTARNVVDRFEFDVLAGVNNLSREIKVYGLNRPGLELAGFNIDEGQDRRIVLLSRKEYLYMNTLKPDVRIERYKTIVTEDIPLIIITDRFNDDILTDIAKEFGCPLVRAKNIPTTKIFQNVLDLFDEYFAPTTEVHASLINVFGKGVLVKGKSGIGKSELTLELVKKNHLFVGDDRIVITERNKKVFGKSHELLKHMIEVRGLGAIDLSKIYGLQILLDETKIDLVIELILVDDAAYTSIDRIGGEYQYATIIDTKVPTITLPVTYGRNISELVETAVAKLKLEEAGISSSEILQHRLAQKLS